jgi:hypothetical protein
MPTIPAANAIPRPFTAPFVGAAAFEELVPSVLLALARPAETEVSEPAAPVVVAVDSVELELVVPVRVVSPLPLVLLLAALSTELMIPASTLAILFRSVTAAAGTSDAYTLLYTPKLESR